MERLADAGRAQALYRSKGPPDPKGAIVRIRIVTFKLNIPVEAYVAHAVHIAPGFTEWPGLLSKWWIDDNESGTFGGVYLFSSQHDADRSRQTELFRGMFVNPALKDVSVREFDVLDAPTAITARVSLVSPTSGESG
jgi:hypothetical protein